MASIPGRVDEPLAVRLAEVRDAISARFPDAHVRIDEGRCMVLVEIGGTDGILPLCRHLKSDLDIDHSTLITAVDMLERFDLVYHFWSTRRRINVQVKVPVGREDPRAPSIYVAPDTGETLWRGANFHERETYDMMGIVFEGHPDLRRIYLEQDATIFPQRKDYAWGEKYG